MDDVFEVLVGSSRGAVTRMAELTGFKPGAVVEWRRAGKFPSKLFVMISTHLAAAGYVAAPELFGMVLPDEGFCPGDAAGTGDACGGASPAVAFGGGN